MTIEFSSKSAVILLSGGQDSTTALWWAKQLFEKVSAISIDYNQRHRSELQAAIDIARMSEVDHEVVDLYGYGVVVKSALTRTNIPISLVGGLKDLPSTFTPGRNLVFLTVAASYALSRGIVNVVCGVCETDYSGYPDCREETIRAQEQAIRLGNDSKEFYIHTPLMRLTKAETVKLMRKYPETAWNALGRSVTCYNGLRPGCATCPACLLRAKGFTEADELDPARAVFVGAL